MKIETAKLAQLIKEELEVILTDAEANEMFGLENIIQKMNEVDLQTVKIPGGKCPGCHNPTKACRNHGKDCVRRTGHPSVAKDTSAAKETPLDEALPGVDPASRWPEEGSPARETYCNADPKIDKHFINDCMKAETKDIADDALELGRNYGARRSSRDEDAINAKPRPGTWAAKNAVDRSPPAEKHRRTYGPYSESRDRTSLTKNQLADLIREELESMLGEDEMSALERAYHREAEDRPQYAGGPRKGHFKGPTPKQKAEKRRAERAAAKAAAEKAKKEAEDDKLNRMAQVGGSGIALEEEETNEGCGGACEGDKDKKKKKKEVSPDKGGPSGSSAPLDDRPREAFISDVKEGKFSLPRNELADMIREEMARVITHNEQ